MSCVHVHASTSATTSGSSAVRSSTTLPAAAGPRCSIPSRSLAVLEFYFALSYGVYVAGLYALLGYDRFVFVVRVLSLARPGLDARALLPGRHQLPAAVALLITGYTSWRVLMCGDDTGQVHSVAKRSGMSDAPLLKSSRVWHARCFEVLSWRFWCSLFLATAATLLRFVSRLGSLLLRHSS